MTPSITDDLKILLSHHPATISALAAEVRAYPIVRSEKMRTESDAVIEKVLLLMRADGEAEYVPGKGWKLPTREVVKQGSLF